MARRRDRRRLINDVNAKITPEAVPGALPLFGFRITSLLGLDPGEYLLMFYHFCPGKNYRSGNERTWTDMIYNPLKINYKLVDGG